MTLSVQPTDVVDARSLDAYDLAPPVEVFRLEAAGINNATLGVRAGNGELIWKTYQTGDEPAPILWEHRLLAWLDGLHLSFGVPAPLAAHSGETLTRSPHGWQALFVRLPGRRPDPRSLGDLEAAGAALGELHTALSHYSAEPRPDPVSYGDLARVHPRIADPYALRPEHLGLPNAAPQDHQLKWWREELASLHPFIDHIYPALPYQVIHADYWPSNTLVQDGRITAVLDFDFAGHDARAMDVATVLKSVLPTRDSESWEPLRAVCRGYRRRVALSGAEIEALPRLIRLRDAVSTVWWLGRGLAAGNVAPQLRRIESMQASARWLEAHGDRLVDVAGEAGR